MRHFEILVGRDGFTVDQIKTRWYLVEKAANGWHRLTGCRGCWGPLQMLQHRAINTHLHFHIPADQVEVQVFAEWAGYDLGEHFWRDWDDEDDLPEETS